jgi:hypothetical protein
MKSSIRKKDKSKNVSRQVRIILSVLRKYVYLTIDGIEITLSKEQRKKIVNEYILEWSNHECIDTMVLDDMFYLKIWHKIRRALTDKKLWHNPYKGGHSKKLVNVTDVRFVFTNLTNHHMKLLEVDNKIFT